MRIGASDGEETGFVCDSDFVHHHQRGGDFYHLIVKEHLIKVKVHFEEAPPYSYPMHYPFVLSGEKIVVV